MDYQEQQAKPLEYTEVLFLAALDVLEHVKVKILNALIHSGLCSL
jgi:hypothetical protein